MIRRVRFEDPLEARDGLPYGTRRWQVEGTGGHGGEGILGELRAETFEVRATAAGSGRRENLVLPGETK